MEDNMFPAWKNNEKIRKQKDPKRVAAGKKAAETRKRNAASVKESPAVNSPNVPRYLPSDIALKGLSLGNTPTVSTNTPGVASLGTGSSTNDLRIKNLQPAPKPDYNKEIPTVKIKPSSQGTSIFNDGLTPYEQKLKTLEEESVFGKIEPGKDGLFRTEEARRKIALSSEQAGTDALLEIYDDAQEKYHKKLIEERAKVDGTPSQGKVSHRERMQKSLEKKGITGQVAKDFAKEKITSNTSIFGEVEADENGLYTTQKNKEAIEKIEKETREIKRTQKYIKKDQLRSTGVWADVATEQDGNTGQVASSHVTEQKPKTNPDGKTSNKAKWGKRAGYMGVGMAVLGAAGLAVNSLMINDKGRMNNAQMYGQQPYSQY